MFRRPSIRSALTTVAAATVLVGGADLASYAATGKPLILGHANSAIGTTSLKNLGRGPALSLNSAKSSPPLLVNSTKLVEHLNADRLGGKSASKLEPRAIRYHVGSPGQSYSGSTQHFFTTEVQPGTYQVGITGLVTEDTAGPTDSYTCLIADKSALLAFLGGAPGALRRMYAINGAEYGSFDYGVVTDTNHVQQVDGSTLVYGCALNGTGTFTIRRAMTFTLRPVTAQDKSGNRFTISKAGVQRLGRGVR